MPHDELRARCAAILAELGLAAEADIAAVKPLTGGVASDIALVEIGGARRVCAKFALGKLRVEADWRVPTHRNKAEYAWLAWAGRLLPDSAVGLLGHSEAQRGFVMEFIEGDDVYLWKAALLAEAEDRGEAVKVGDAIGRIHAASVAGSPGFDAAPFANRDVFYAKRIEPYIEFTARRYDDTAPDIAAALDGMAASLQAAHGVLVHGDISPKNIMMRGGHPVFLDAECADMGDPAFDVAFCVNHLCLKALHLPRARGRYMDMARRLWAAYAAHIDWEDKAAIEARVARLLPMLFLARADGKSPVEYLNDAAREQVREIALALIRAEYATLDAVFAYMREAMGEG